MRKNQSNFEWPTNHNAGFWLLNWIELIRWSKLTFRVDVSLTKKVLIMKFYWRCLTFDFVEFIPGKSLLSWSMSLAFWGDCVEFDRWCVDVFLLWDMFRLESKPQKKMSNDSILLLPLAIWREKLVRKLRLIARSESIVCEQRTWRRFQTDWKLPPTIFGVQTSQNFKLHQCCGVASWCIYIGKLNVSITFQADT